MADLSDHVEKLIGAWKAVLPVIAVVAGGTFWFATTLYEREIASLKAERDSARSELADVKAKQKAVSPAPNPIEDEGPLIWSGSIAMVGGPLSGRNVFDIRFRALNKSKEALKIKSAMLVSGVDGRTLDLEIEAGNEIVRLSEIGLIPAGAPIVFVAKFGPPDPSNPRLIMGLEAKDFLEHWRLFSLEVEDQKRKYHFEFGEAYMSTFFPGMIGPRVTKKEN